MIAFETPKIEFKTHFTFVLFVVYRNLVSSTNIYQ